MKRSIVGIVGCALLALVILDGCFPKDDSLVGPGEKEQKDTTLYDVLVNSNPSGMKFIGYELGGENRQIVHGTTPISWPSPKTGKYLIRFTGNAGYEDLPVVIEVIPGKVTNFPAVVLQKTQEVLQPMELSLTGPDSANVGETVTIRVTSKNVIVAVVDGVGQVPANGTFTVVINDTRTLVATGYGKPSIPAFASWTTYVRGSKIPATPTLFAPANGATDVPSGRILFSWNPVLGATSYELEISEALIGNVVFPKTTDETSLAVTTLGPGIQYTWQVRAKNSFGTSGWSPAWIFKTAGDDTPLLPAIPVLTEPANGATNVSILTLFSWSPAPRAKSYEWRISTRPDFLADSSSSLTTTDVIIRLPVSLAYAKKYYWRVRAENAFGATEWSPTWMFVTERVPAQYAVWGTLTTNKDSVLAGESVEVTWTSSPDVQEAYLNGLRVAKSGARTMTITATTTIQLLVVGYGDQKEYSRTITVVPRKPAVQVLEGVLDHKVVYLLKGSSVLEAYLTYGGGVQVFWTPGKLDTIDIQVSYSGNTEAGYDQTREDIYLDVISEYGNLLFTSQILDDGIATPHEAWRTVDVSRANLPERFLLRIRHASPWAPDGNSVHVGYQPGKAEGKCRIRYHSN